MKRATQLLPLVSVVRRFTLAFAIAAFAMIAAVVLILNHMVVVRLLGEPIVWHVELSVQLTLAAAFLGAPYAVLTNGNVAVDLLPTALPIRLAKLVRIAILVISLGVCLYLTAAGAVRASHAFVTDERSTSLWAPPLWPVYAAMPIGLGLACLQMLAEVISISAAPSEPHR